jgi:hypothetical protein
MMKLKIDFLKKYLQEIKRNIKTLLTVLRLPLYGINGEAIVSMSGSPRIGLPLDPPSNAAVIKKLIGAGLNVGEPFVGDGGYGRYWSIYGLGVSLDIAAFPHNEGSTCQIVGISEETITKKVFEVVCDDGAKESVF